MLLGYFVHAIKNGWYVINSPWTIDECRTFEIHSTSTGKEKMEHAGDSHDDGIFATAISTFINHDYDTLADRGNKTLLPRSEDAPPEIDIMPIGPFRMNQDISRDSNIPLDSLLRSGEDIERFRY